VDEVWEGMGFQKGPRLVAETAGCWQTGKMEVESLDALDEDSSPLNKNEPAGWRVDVGNCEAD
jgi:hypothetical protein